MVVGVSEEEMELNFWNSSDSVGHMFPLALSGSSSDFSIGSLNASSRVDCREVVSLNGV